MTLPERPITVLIAALGGEGGGVMADWLIEAAAQCGYPAQSTSVPGVAQRTGSTTYYLEIYPAGREQLGRREPVMSLTPSPGNVDVMVASELLEAGRELRNGYVNPERTTLIASTHRIYTTAEKMQMGDGRFASGRVLDAARTLARRAVLFDMRALAQESGTVINSVLFGAMAGSGALALPRAACEAAIRSAGRGAEASLRGFAAGYDIAAGAKAAPAEAPQALPPDTQQVIDLGVARLKDYQGDAYAALYRERVRSLGTAAPQLVGEVARQLALWMSYEDVIRVADLKTRASRFARVRREVGAREGEPVVVIDYLKPGIEELASLLPPAPGARLGAWAQKRGRPDRSNLGLRIKTSSVSGFLLMRVLAWLRPWRPYTWRYRAEQQLIERWLDAVRRAAPRSTALALEIAECAGLLKGYGDTHRRGLANFRAILDAWVDGTPDIDDRERATAIKKAREAALADPDGHALQKNLGKRVLWMKQTA
jgi:indolepyruvate ferredoxin oxidoreductase beta subunit